MILLTNLGKIFLRWLGLFWAVSVVAFLLPRLMPDYPVHYYLQQYQLPVTPENIQIVEEQWGLNRSLFVQYGHWLGRFIQGDWGRAYMTGLDVRAELFRRLPYSLLMACGGLLLGGLWAYVLGFLAVLQENGFWGKVSRVHTLLASTFPSLISGVLLIYLLSNRWKLLSFYGEHKLPGVLISSLLIAFYQSGHLTRIVIRHLEEVKAQAYIQTMQTRGFSLKTVLWKYGYHYTMYGLLSAMLPQFSWVIGGTSILEYTFAIPGISAFLIDSISHRDYVVIQGYLMLTIAWMFGMHVIVEGLLVSLQQEEAAL